MQEKFDLVQKGFRILHPLMAKYIFQEVYNIYQEDWWNEILKLLSDQSRDLPSSGEQSSLIDSLDIPNCLRIFDRAWGEIFRNKLSIDYRTWSKELMGVRNTVSHQGQQDLEQSYAERALDTMALLCEAFDKEGAEEIRSLYRVLRYGSAEGSTNAEALAPTQKKKNIAAVLTKKVGMNLPSWRDVIQPHPDVAEGRYKAAEFAADLAQVARGEGAYEYRDPVEFFSRTYITDGMTGLLVQSIERIAGKGGEPVIQLKTAFGGGKTHTMLALYHMVRGSSSFDYIPNLKPILKKAELESFPKANVAVLVGTALDPSHKKNPSNLPGYTVSTIWGEMAYQLVVSAGKPELYAKYIRESDRKGVSPGSENLKNLFNECGPCLILMDELVAYAKKLYGANGLPAGSYDNFVTFIQEVTEAARASENSIVVASIPESDIEIGGDAGKIVLETIEHTFGRMESIWKPVSANEGFEVVRRRLFLDCKNPDARDAVCDSFSKLYRDNATDFPLETKELEYRNRLIACYPIHPEVFDRLYGDWATMERFQRTRGVLRLMAAVIHELWMANDASAMIMAGSIPLDMPNVRDELVRHLPDTWNSIIDREVDGKDSIPFQKDQANIRYGQKLAARRIARTIMLGSAPSTSALREQGIRGLELSRILLGTVQPDERIADFKDALVTLHGALSYLYSTPNGNRYWYDTKPTLRKTAEDRATQISRADVEIEIENRLKKIRKENPFAGIHVCPTSSNDVPDEQSVRLVILRTQDSYRNKSNNSSAMNSVNEILNNRGTYPRTFRNMLSFVAPDQDKLSSLQQEVKRYIAWSSILADKDDLNLDGNQLRETQNNLKRSNDTIDMRLKETYCWLIVPYIDQYNDKKTIQWEISDIGGGSEGIVAKVTRKMQQNEQVITKWAPALLQMVLDQLLWKENDYIQISKLWEYICTYCYLPRVCSYSVLEDAIYQGLASLEFFGIAAAYAEDKKRFIDLRIGQPVFSINRSDLLVKPKIALKQIQEEAGSKISKTNEEETSQEITVITSKDPSTVEKTGNDSIKLKTQSLNKHFYMSVKLDNTRINRDINNYVQEIVQHLLAIEGADIEMKFEVEVNAPNGIPNNTVRTVSENCRTLKIDDFGFDE